MKLIQLSYLLENLSFFAAQALSWKIFVFPTDTLYGIWSVPTEWVTQRIYRIKNRDLNKPLSIIAPNVEWILKNFQVKDNFEEYINESLKTYHGITIILAKKKQDFLPAIWKDAKVWVRLLKHPFQEFVSYLNQPFICTSANLSWNPSTFKLDQIESDIITKVDYVIDWWELFWKPSVILDGTSVLRREG